MSRLEVGDKAPAFTLTSDQGKTVSLDELLAASKRGTIIYFYPRAATPGCTTQACDFRDNLGALQALGYTVVGISPDPVSRLEKFRDNKELSFPLLSDPDKTVATAYGAWGEKNNYGRLILGLIRSTFVIDRSGKVAHALYNVRAKGHVQRLRELLEQD